MGTSGVKPVKIKLNNATASSMYILLTKDEIRFTKENETKPPNRNYKIEIAVEAMFENKRCRGKSLTNIPKGTSIGKAVASLLGKREEMKETLRTKGTLKIVKKKIKKINTKDRKFKSVYDAWISGKRIEVSGNTIRVYQTCYNNYLKSLDKKIIDDITEDDVQNIINTLINRNLSNGTIRVVKLVLKPTLEINDVYLNWRKIVLPKYRSNRKYKGTDEKAILISKILLNSKHPVARGVFAFLLTGRRIGETLLMEHKHIDYINNTFTLPKEITKTNTEVTYILTSSLVHAIKIQKTKSGKIFNLKRDTINNAFHEAMRSIEIYDMTPHDLRSMLAVVSLRNGADIYSVSKMLSHKKISTTEASYLGDGVERAKEAQDTFTALIGKVDSVIDVEIEDSEFTALKSIYPDAKDEKIYKIIEMMK